MGRMAERYSEDELIATLFAPLAGPGALGLSDDAAIVPAGDGALVITADMLVAGVHFFPDDPPALIAQKALRTNLSDLAGKAAAPVGFLLSIALPPDWTNEWLAAFAGGLGADARAYGAPLLGGDTSATPGPLTIAITALGRAAGRVPRRNGAQAGDGVFVSGTIGDAALGLALRREPGRFAGLAPSARAFLLDRYLLPYPRVDLIDIIGENVTASMDISDGLVGDLAKICRVSGVSALIDANRTPLSEAARAALARDPTCLVDILTGGDDYELLFTARPDFRPPPGIVRIGEILAGYGPPVFRGAGGELLAFPQPAFRHF
jgi:thiamine-monophosphate kinase